MKALAALALTLPILALPSGSLAAARISSNSNCPSPDAISVRLLGLVAAGGPETASARVRIEGASMHIEVSTPGEESRQRTVEASGDCDGRAEMAAFIIAAWLDVMPVGRLRAPGIPPREVQPLPRSGPKSEALAVSLHLQAGGGLFGLADELGSSLGWAAMVGMPSLVENAGWLLEVSMTSTRQMAVGQGTAHLRRPTFALAATFELYRDVWLVRAQVGPVLGVLLVEGTGYYSSQKDTSVMWGANVGFSVARTWDGHEAWLRLDANAWPQGRSVLSSQLLSTTIAVPLPSWEVRSMIGFSFGIL